MNKFVKLPLLFFACLLLFTLGFPTQTMVLAGETGIELASTDHKQVDGKMVVTAKIFNHNISQNAGIVAVGFDSSGTPVEAKGTFSYVNYNKATEFTVTLDEGSKITNVKVTPTGNVDSQVVLAGFGYRLVNGKMVVTAVAENGNISQNAGVTAIGYDAQGNAIEAKGAFAYLNYRGTGNYQLILDPGSAIKSVKVIPTGNLNSSLQVTGYGVRTMNGKKIITGVVENGNISQNGGMVAVGYNAQGQPIESRGAFAYLNYKGLGNFQVILNDTVNTKSLKVFATGTNRSGIKVVGSGNRQVNGKMEVTGVVENGNISQNGGIVAISFDAAGRPLEAKSVYAYLAYLGTGNFQMLLDGGSLVKQVKVLPTGNLQSGVQVLGYGYRFVNGKMIVTAVAENGNISSNVTVTAVGYDSKGKPIETKSAAMYLKYRGTGNYTIPLAKGASVKSVKVFANKK